MIEFTSVLVAFGIWIGNGLQPLEQWAYVALFNTHQTVLPTAGWDDRIVVIAIDDATLRAVNQFPLPRALYTQLLSKIDPALPSAVVFDILFTESTPDDEAFAQAISNSWNVVLAIAADSYGKPLDLVPELAKRSAALGHVHIKPDVDGIPRRIDLYQEDVPALGVAALQIVEESLSATIGSSLEQQPILSHLHRINPSALPHNQAWINWPAPVQDPLPNCSQNFKPGELHIYSFICVTEGAIPTSLFADKVVLIGATAQGLDLLHMPYKQSRYSSNVYLHAALIDNLLNDQLLQRVPIWVEALLLLGLSLFSITFLKQLCLVSRIGVLTGFPIAWFSLAVLGLQINWWLPVAAPIGIITISFLGVQAHEQWEKQELMHLFETYVSAERAEHIWNHREDVLSQGVYPIQDMVTTLLFVDIRGFTHVSEELSPRELMTWLNRYFQQMTVCITAYGGTVDKYIGDEIMAVFSPPEQTSAGIRQSASNAIAASYSMVHELQMLNQKFQAEGLPTIKFGIGINTGHVAAGNVGSKSRVNYSCVGDTVNVASRIQNMNKVITDFNPHNILLSQATYSYVSDRYIGHRVGQLFLRGRQKSIVVYSILNVSSTLAHTG